MPVVKKEETKKEEKKSFVEIYLGGGPRVTRIKKLKALGQFGINKKAKKL